jgi:hypothetical protein
MVLCLREAPMTTPFTVNGYADGLLDGKIDAAQAAAGLPVKGMDPAKSWSIRYRRGYSEAFPDGGVEVYEQGGRQL